MAEPSSTKTPPKDMVFVLIVLVVVVLPASANNPGIFTGTFSIIAYDSLTGEIGGAVQSKVLAVGRIVLHVLPDIGAIATQALSNYTYGPEGLQLLELNIPVETVIDVLTSKDQLRDLRQLGIVDANMHSASYTGKNCSLWAGHITGPGYAIQGNILAGEAVVLKMEEAFLETPGSLAERLLAALQAGQEAGGDSRGRQSSAILIKKPGFENFINLRVDDHEFPIQELKRIYQLHQRSHEPGDRIHAADLFLKEGKADRAEYELELAMSIAEMHPEDADLQNNVAWGLAIHDLMLTDALRFAQRAVEKAPDRGYIWDTLGEVHFRLGSIEDAIRAQEHAVERAPNEPLFRERLEEWKENAQRVNN